MGGEGGVGAGGKVIKNRGGVGRQTRKGPLLGLSLSGWGFEESSADKLGLALYSLHPARPTPPP